MGSPGIEPVVGSVTSRKAGPATAWGEIERLVEDVSTLARQATSPADFYGPLLTRLVPLLTALGGAVWSSDSRGGFRLVCQLQLPDDFVAAGTRDAHGELLLQAVREGQPLRSSLEHSDRAGVAPLPDSVGWSGPGGHRDCGASRRVSGIPGGRRPSAGSDVRSRGRLPAQSAIG